MNIRREFPTYELEEVKMRKLRFEDAADMLNYLTDKEVTKYLPDEAHKNKLTEVKEMIKNINKGFENKDKIRWGIEYKKNSKVIGDCGFYKIDLKNKSGEISYRLSKDYWKKGLMTDILWQMLFYGFEKLKLNRIEASVLPNNIGSIKLLEKLGFKKEGVFRDALFKNNDYYNLKVYSLLQKEYNNIK